MAKKIKSVSMSMEGWHILEWLKGNWKSVKELAKVGAPLLLGWVATNHPVWTVFITLLGKFVLDVGEYYLKQHEA